MFYVVSDSIVRLLKFFFFRALHRTKSIATYAIADVRNADVIFFIRKL